MHTSSSGLDLPMKVVDMLSVGLPCLSVDFPAIEELLPEEKFGNCLFRSRQDLVGCIERRLQESNPASTNNRSKPGQSQSWQEAWDEVCLPILRSSIRQN